MLDSLDAMLLLEAECYFGGGTAVVLQLNEYRESMDIDFLCAATDGYRLLRKAVWGDPSMSRLFRSGAGVQVLREPQADQYGIRTILEVNGSSIRFEIVREGRVTLHGAMDDRLGVPLLDQEDLYLEKLLANADRWNDRSVMSRDIIDLSMMMTEWGGIPQGAWRRAREAYDDTVDRAYSSAVARIGDTAWLGKCLTNLQMDSGLAPAIQGVHRES